MAKKSVYKEAAVEKIIEEPKKELPKVDDELPVKIYADGKRFKILPDGKEEELK
jgi:hypothetical protein